MPAAPRVLPRLQRGRLARTIGSRREGQPMTEDETDEGRRRAEAEAAIEREIRLGHKFTARDALARMAGPGALKGASPVSPVQQAETAIATWLGANLADTDGALRVVLHRHLKGS